MEWQEEWTLLADQAVAEWEADAASLDVLHLFADAFELGLEVNHLFD